MGTHTSAKQHESQEFAKTIGNHLDSARCQGKFDKLIIMSSPAFLGQLRKQMSSETRKYVHSEIDKNLVRHNTSDIQEHLPFYI
jgi:protein required for attachment to host cells